MQLPIISHFLLRIENAAYPPHHEMEAVGAPQENIYVQESMAGKQRELSAELLQEGLSYMEKRARYKLDATVYLLGQMYLWGIFVPQDENKGVEWLEMLALSGDSEACGLLCYYFAGNAPAGKTPRSQPDPAKIRYYASLDRRRALRDGMLSPKLMLY